MFIPTRPISKEQKPGKRGAKLELIKLFPSDWQMRLLPDGQPTREQARRGGTGDPFQSMKRKRKKIREVAAC